MCDVWPHPEDIVDEQPPQQDAAGADVVQVEQLHTVQGKRQTKEVIGYPVLWCHKTLTGYWLSCNLPVKLFN